MSSMLIDTHCHLCAGLDDGPQTLDDALEMCEIAYRSGTAWIAATAHQNETYPEVHPQGIIDSVQRLGIALSENELPICIRPTAEVMLCPDILTKWDAGHLLSYDNQKKYLLVEYPHGTFFDIRKLVRDFRSRGVRLVLAHPERQPELLHGLPALVELIRLGCLIQISAASLERSRTKEDERALKTWVRSGAVHLIGSDGHSPKHRPPVAEGGHRRLAEWIGTGEADRICTTNGLAVLQGLPLDPPQPSLPKPRSFFSWLLSK